MGTRRPVPVHSHGGLELTLVIGGSFSDATGSYGVVICRAPTRRCSISPMPGPKRTVFAWW